MCDIYSLFSDIDLMRDMVQRGVEKSRNIAFAHTDYLVGAPETTVPETKKGKPMHPCFMAAPKECNERPLLLFDVIDPKNTIELQYGTLVYLALDADALNSVASASFPAAADFARTIPLLVEKSLLGSRSSAAQVPIEFVVKFVLMLMNIYNA